VTLLAAPLPMANARTRPHYGGTLRIETEADPWQKFASPVRRLVFEGLTRVDGSGTLRPALAIDWKSDSEDHRWRLQIRAGVHFHDSSALTAAAVAASLQESCSASCPWAAIHAVGNEVIFTSDAAMPNLPVLLAGDGFVIQHPSSNGGVDGTGPFQTAGFSNGVLTLKANVDHWAGRPFVDAIEVRTRRLLADQWTDLEAGRADIVEVPAERLRQAKQLHMIVLQSRPVELVALEVNSTGVLSSLNLRRAIGAAVDRGVLFNVIFQKQGEVTASLAPEWMTGYSFLFPTTRDLNKAHELRGGAAPSALTLAVDSSDSTLQLVSGRIALNLREAGFNVQVFSKGSRQQADLLLKMVPLDAGESGAAVESMQRAFEDRDSSNPPAKSATAEEQAQAMLHFEQEVVADARVIPLIYLPRGYAIGSRVRDMHLNLDASIDLADTSLEESK